nr:reverse transcriptase domain-containing protein [Tanacetum cinerariifolium]
MSSPNHHTFNIKDAFSSNFPNYILASSDYVPASPGKTYFSSSNNSFGLVPIASPTLSLFHDDPYMKVMHAYYAKELPIPPPVIIPPYLMLPPIFNPRDFFVPKELLSPKKQIHFLSSSPTPPHILIFCCLVNVDRISPKRTSTSAAPTMNQATIRQLIDDCVTAALEAQAANMANTNNTNRNPEPTETLAARKFKKMEDEFYNLVMKGNDLKTYPRRFQELTALCPNMVPNTEKLMEVFIGGLPRSIEGNVTASKPQTLEEAINITRG